jgi:hypothetical protein
VAISVGSVEVDVVPNTQGIYQRLRDGLVPAATKAGEDAGKAAGRSFGPAMQAQIADVGLRIGEEIGAQIAARVTVAIRNAIRDGVTQGGQTARPAATKQGDDTGGAFARAMKARLEAAFKSLPKVNIDADTSEADADLQALRARMEALASKHIGIDIDAQVARTEIDDIDEELRRLGASHPNVTVRADTAKARADLAAVREEIDRISANPGTIRLETDGLLGQRVRAAVAEAEATLPNINIDADTGPAQAEIASLRAQLTALKEERIGIDIDAATALARIDEIQARLARLSASDADIAVRVDAAAAQARLAAIQAMVAGLDGDTARIDIDTSGALSAVFQLTLAIGALAALPAFPVLAAGVGLFTSAVVAAGVGVGALAAVALPAFAGISGALQAQKAAQDAATNASLKGNQAASQGASKALQAAGAQQALAAAERNGAVQIAQASEQVALAKRAVGDAVQQAALKTQQAERAVQDAERALTQAQKDAAKAQLDLTAARKQAVLDLEDLNNQLIDSQLSQRDAVIQVQQATAALHAIQNNPNATALQREQAQLTYDQAVQHLKEQGTQVKRLQDQTTAANKAGVDGSTGVKNAQNQLAQAQQQVADRTRALKDAQDEQARTAVANARAISDAQQKVADSERAAAQAQAQAADSIASAQRSIASASASAAGGVNQAAVAQAQYQQALDKLTPAARGTFTAFLSLRDAFKAWSVSLQPQVMGIFTRAILGLRAALPSLTPFVLAAATAIKVLQDRASVGFRSPWWKTFKQDLATSVTPAILGLGVGFGNIFKGMVGIIDAFLPHLAEFGARFGALTARFANWAAGLKGSPAFEQFLAYASRMAPVLAGTLRDVAAALFQVSHALSPLSGPALVILGALARGIASVATTLPWLVQGMYLVLVATRLWTIATWALNVAMRANPIGLIITAVVALVVAVIYAYNHWTNFRIVVQLTWLAIRTAALWAWNNVLKPVFNALVVAVHAVGTAAVWLWQNVLQPVWNAISLGARILFAIIFVVLITPLILAFRAVGAIASWLWDVAIGPAFRAIATGATWLWNQGLRPYLAYLVDGFKWVGSIATWLWQNAIQPAFSGIATVAVWLYQNMIKPYFDLMVAEFQLVASIGMWLWNNALAPAFRGIAAVATWLWQNAIQPVFSGIASAATWLYDHGLKPVFDSIKSAVGLVGEAFGAAKDAIGVAWGKIVDLTKAPVNFVIKWVYTNGIKAVWDKVAGFVGLDKLPDAPQLLAAGGTLGNGWGPARPMVTNRPTAIVGEGNPLYPEYVIPTDPKYRNRALALHAAAGTQLLDGGGILGGLKSAWNWTKDTVGDVVGTGIDWAKKGADLIANPGQIWDSLVKPILSKVADGVGAFPMGKILTQFPIKMVGGLKDKIVHAVSSIGSFFGGGSGGGGVGAPPGSGVTRWTPQVIQALAANGLSTSPDMVAKILRQIETESGGNEKAVQGDIGDINNITGDLAKGLMQTISATFNAYKFPGHGDIFNGYDNLLAALNYAKHRYGASLSFLGQGHGYDSGGYLQPGFNLAYNGTGRPEPVLTTQQTNALVRLAAEPAAGGGVFEGDLYLDSGAFLGHVRGEVHQQIGNLTATLAAGRR